MEYGPAPEAEQPALEWITRHGGEFGLYVGGRWVKGQDGRGFDVINPATRAKLARVVQAGPADVSAAVAAARAALPGWAALPGHARARHLYALARAVQKHARLLAVLESLDNGKSIRETRDIDIPLVARHFYHHAGWAQLLETEFAGHGPAGVVGQIIPWNFPLLMVAWKVAPALAAGCTVVLKPAEFTPLTALAFAELAHEAGLPAGVLNVITGDGESGKLLVDHPDVDKIAFTGSTEVGRHIRQATAGTGKKLSLELGGKSPFIVFEDADLDSVVEGVVDAIWFNQGQVCCAGSRLLVQEGVAAPLIGKLRARMEKLRVGSPLDKAVDMGAIVAPVQLERIRGLVEKGVEEGAQMWQPSWACPTDGYFYPPTLFTDVSPSATIAQVEIFGPVLVSMTFRTPAEAVALANNTPFGLAASVWTENINLALDIAPKIKAGVVWVNCTNLFDAAAGFGGYRESGFGREGGREGMWEYLKPEWETANAERGTRNEPAATVPRSEVPVPRSGQLPDIDRTPKLFIGGKQVRPDQTYSRRIVGPDGRVVGEVGEGNRRADKWDGAVHHTPVRGVTLAMNEPIGVVGVACPAEAPLLGFVSLVAPLVATGNTVVAIPSEAAPLAATDFYAVLETSDLPAGVINILTGSTDALAQVLAEHLDVDGVWYFGASAARAVEAASAGNMKRTWVEPHRRDWLDPRQGEGREFLRHATQVKNIWIPYGE
ncbi:MAG: aldehyde dehydrogenase [Gemmatimonadetes bacterium]|nr:MAG: aldehyde dehydrogenase [Gemmatimonadota bacterium]